MPTGERTTRAVCQAGFTYLVLLLAIAIGAAGLAALGTQWRTKLQRDRETELLFRGREIGAAIQAYRAAVPGLKQWPTRFEDLLEDRRQGDLRRHLRRLYTDPFTGQADWVLTATEDGGFRGVRSRSQAPAFITRAFNDELAALDAAAAQRRVSEHFFGVSASAAAPSASATRSPNPPHPPHPPNSARP